MLEANAFRLGLRVRVFGYTFQNFKILDDSEGGMCRKKLLCSQRDFKLWGQEVDCVVLGQRSLGPQFAIFGLILFLFGI